MVSPAQARSARKWDAKHREIMRKAAAKSSTKRYILKLANEDELKEVQQWLAKRKDVDTRSKQCYPKNINVPHVGGGDPEDTM